MAEQQNDTTMHTRTRIENHKKLHAQNQRLMWTTALQEQTPLLDTPEDGQLGQNM
jgi:hypothetical protein